MEFIFGLLDRLPMPVVIAIPAITGILAILILTAIALRPTLSKSNWLDRKMELVYLLVQLFTTKMRLMYNVWQAKRLVCQLKKMINKTSAPTSPSQIKEFLTLMGFMVWTPTFALAAMWYISQLGNGLLVAVGDPPGVLPGWMLPSILIAGLFIGGLAGMAHNENRASSR